AKFVYQRTKQPRCCGVQSADESRPILGAIDFFLNTSENLLNLLIKFCAVGNDQNTSIGNIFAYPLGKPDHGQALTRTLRMPDNSAFAVLNKLMSRIGSKKLVMATGLFYARIKHN